jgi:PGDYG protein
MFIRDLFEDINEDWFKGAKKVYKIANPINYETAKQDGTIKTLEGPVNYKAGYKIITGPAGEKYPIPPEKFEKLYNDHGAGSATPRKLIKLAKLADHNGSVKTSWGETLNYTKGDDYIVRHGENDYGVVKKDIFAQTYQIES